MNIQQIQELLKKRPTPQQMEEQLVKNLQVNEDQTVLQDIKNIVSKTRQYAVDYPVAIGLSIVGSFYDSSNGNGDQAKQNEKEISKVIEVASKLKLLPNDALTNYKEVISYYRQMSQIEEEIQQIDVLLENSDKEEQNVILQTEREKLEVKLEEIKEQKKSISDDFFTSILNKKDNVDEQIIKAGRKIL